MPRISIRKMADALGVAKSQVHRAAQAGMPMDDVAAACAWRLENNDVSRSKEGRIDRPGPQPAAPNKQAPAADGLAAAAGDGAETDAAAPPADDEPADEHTAAFREHRANRERINAERGQIELDQLRGRLRDGAEMDRLGFTAFRMLRDAILNVPQRVKDQVAAETDAFLCEQMIEAELTAALASFNAARLMQDVDDDEAD